MSAILLYDVRFNKFKNNIQVITLIYNDKICIKYINSVIYGKVKTINEIKIIANKMFAHIKKKQMI